jgi:RNA polymerase sigma factor (sigma-70 family)
MKDFDSVLLARFVKEQSQDAFTEIVRRHLNLVYSAALRQARSPEIAEEISTAVFSQLAQRAASLAPETILTAWLYRVACNAAIDVVRREARRQAREQIAFQMSSLNDAPPPDWVAIESMLDEAMQSLDDEDRTAVLLRFFEKKSLREVGDALGASEDAAQKRVSRALDQLREFFDKRKISLGAAALAALISANAVQSAPAALMTSVSSAALASTGISTSATIAITKAVVMTTFQKTIAGLALAGAIALSVYQAHQASVLRQDLQQERDKNATLNANIGQLEKERDHATNAAALLAVENETLKKRPTEVMKLRSEVGVLKDKNAKLGSSSALSKVTADPATKKLMREQQKVGMTMLYKSFADRAKLKDDDSRKFYDLLADHIMQNVDNVTTILRDKIPADQMNRIFSDQDAALNEQLSTLLGQDGLKNYQDYSQNLLATLTAEQFKAKMSGTPDEQNQKVAQLAQLMEQQAQSVVSAAGLPENYQVLPILNFRNIASEESGTQAVQILTDIYQQVSSRAASFLSPGELTSFQEFQTTAINNNRAALSMNRSMMAPISN